MQSQMSLFQSEKKTPNSSLVSTRELFKAATLSNAASIIEKYIILK